MSFIRVARQRLWHGWHKNCRINRCGLRPLLSKRALYTVMRHQSGGMEPIEQLMKNLCAMQWVADFEKPKGDPALFDPPATTVSHQSLPGQVAVTS